MKYKLFFILLSALVWGGCYDEDALAPTLEPEPVIQFPQGDHDYDTRIMDWYTRCGFYILYKYEPRELYFNMGLSWMEMTTDTLSRTVKYKIDEEAFVDGDNVLIYTEMFSGDYLLGEHVTDAGFHYTAKIEGDYVVIDEEYEENKGRESSFKMNLPSEAYVGKQVAWLEEMFLNLYQDSVLRANLPLKLMLGKNLYKYSKGASEKLSFYSVSNVFALSHGDPSIESMTMQEKRIGKEDLHKWFLIEKLYDKIVSVVKAGEFFSKTDYTEAVGWGANSKFYSLGVVGYDKYVIGWNQPIETAKNNDLKSYIAMVIDYSSDELNAVPDNGKYNRYDCTGVLDPLKDVNGLVKEKYEILLNDFKKMGINLQGIGNIYH